MMLKPASLVSIFIPLDVSQSQLSVVLCCPPCCCWGTPVERRRSGKGEGPTLRALGHVRPSPVDQSAAATTNQRSYRSAKTDHISRKHGGNHKAGILERFCILFEGTYYICIKSFKSYANFRKKSWIFISHD